MIGDMIEALPQKDKWYLLEKHANIIYLPLYLYDHGGITMSTGSFSDKWDSGQVGYIYTDRETVLNTCGNANKKNWKKVAYKDMESEVEVYDQYLTGEVYGAITEIYNSETGEWEEDEDRWGYFSNKWGDNLIREIASDFGINKIFDDIDEVM